MERLPRPIRKRVFDAVGRLGSRWPHHTRRLIGREEYRMWIGDYKLFFDIQDESIRILHLAEVGESRYGWY